MTKQYFLGGGLVLVGLLFVYLLWFGPVYALFMAFGALGGGMFLEFLGALQEEKIVAAPENEWTGI